ncbi:oligopeptide ABC transporter substrate-binding protein OppA [Shigella sonnei]|nr:oligopeptide ABC transporter substrate-binding protein OppA [Shigella sonnei]
MTNITKRSLVAAGVLAALMAGNVALAADVPAGVTLAEKQTLVRNNGSEVQSLDPHKIEGVPESNISRDLFEGLLVSDLDGHPAPGVAESWDNKDAKVWTFHLRKDAKWSDSTPVTAQDFVYSWQRSVDPNTASPYASYLQYGHIAGIDEILEGKKPITDLGVKAIDDHTLEVTLSEPVPYFYKLLVHPSTSPVPKAAIEKFGEKWTQPEWFGWSQEKRNEEAKKLLAEAGYTADKPLTINLLYNTSDLHKKLAIAASSLWKKNIGVNVKLVNQEWKTFLDTRHQGTFDVARAGWCADYNEPTSFLNTMLSNSSMNTAHYKSPAFDSIMAETLKVTDEAQRTALYTKAEQQLDKDSAIVPVYYYVNARLVKPWVGGYTGKDPLDNTYTRNMYIVKH